MCRSFPSFFVAAAAAAHNEDHQDKPNLTLLNVDLNELRIYLDFSSAATARRKLHDCTVVNHRVESAGEVEWIESIESIRRRLQSQSSSCNDDDLQTIVK